MQPSSYKHTAGYKSLMTYIIYQALLDLKSPNNAEREDAKKFLLSNDGQDYCDAIKFDYELIKKIDFNNPTKSLDYNAKVINSN